VTTVSPEEARRRINELNWYHTIDLLPGVTTSGWFDLRHALDTIAFPDLAGARCLDVGTWDGFYAFELERRGAAEVVAVDLVDLADVDYPAEARADPTFDPSHAASQPRTAGFHLAHELLRSSVEWRGCSIYDLDPDELGTFDVVVVGSLLVHLRDPVRALEAVRRVTKGVLLSIDYILPSISLAARRRPLFQLNGTGSDFQWWLPNSQGHRQLLRCGGFEIEAASPPFLLREALGARRIPRTAHQAKQRAMNWLLTRDTAAGHAHQALVGRPRF
jgi:tRNA (mo5U34)-methyltransferase